MKKATRYLLALATCVGLFVLWVLCQMYVAKGTLIGVLFCGAMFGVWKAIVRSDEQASDDEVIVGDLEENSEVDEQ